MKKYFNKSIFKDKSFIKMICFTIVLLLVLVLGNTFGYVSASGYEYCLNEEDYRSSGIYKSNLDQTYVHWSTTKDIRSKSVFSAMADLDFSNVSFSGITSDDIKYYVVSWGSPVLNVYLFEEAPQMYWDGSTYFFVTYEDNCYSVDISYITNGSTLFTDFEVENDSFKKLPMNYSSGTDVYYIPISSIMLSNSNIYAPRIGWQTSFNDIHSAFDVGHMNGQGTDYFENVNYLSNIGLNGFNNLVGVGGTNGGESSLNNLTMTSADWWLNRVGSTGLNRFLGSVTFQGSLTDYQLEHPEEFIVQYCFEGELDFYYQNSYSTELSASFPFLNESIVASMGVDGEASAELKVSYDNYYVQQTLSDFIDSGYQKQFPLMTDVYKNMDANGTYDYEITVTTGLDKHYEGSIDADLSVYDILSLANSENFEITDWKTFDLICSAQILSANNFEVDTMKNVASGWYTETFNMLNGTSTINDSSLLQNDNPYIENNGGITDNTNLPSNNTSGSSSVTQTTGAVTQNVTVTNSGAQYIPSLISKLIPTSLGDTGTGLVESFSTMASTNGFISVMASTVPAIPSTVWVYLTNYLGISLYLLACAFVLRLILDLL